MARHQQQQPQPTAPAPTTSALRAAMFLLYGDPKKSGKTTIFLRTFPRGLFIGERSSIQLVAQSICGFTPEPWQFIEGITTLQQLVTFLTDTTVGLRSPAWQEAIRALAIPAIYVADFSDMCAKSIIHWEQENPNSDFYAFKMLDKYLDWVPALLRELGLLCGLDAHRREPKYDQNKKSRTHGQLLSAGAPEVPSGKQIQAVPGWVDLVAPVEPGNSLDPWWPRVIRVDSSQADLWVSGDRNSVCWAETPANLREILRAAPTPYDLPRLPGLEWQDEVAETVAASLQGGEAVLEVIERIFAHYATYAIPGTPGERHVQWAVQDGIARHTIRAHRALGVLGQLRAVNQGAAPPPPPPPSKKDST